MKNGKKWFSLLMALTLAMSMTVSGFAEEAEKLPVESAAEAAEAAETLEAAKPLDPVAQAARQLFGEETVIYTHHGQLTFVAGSCTDQPITSMAEAETVMNAIAAIETSGEQVPQFIPWRELRDAAGNHYYTFQQMAGGITVCGGAMKIITDSDGRMIGVSCSAVSDLPEVEASEGISAEEAEQIVLRRAAAEGLSGVTLVEGITQKIILSLLMSPDDDEEIEDLSRYVWAVCTTNPNASVANSSDLPYSSHYVTMDGEYLYSLPTVLPGDQAGSTGFDTAYVFEFMEPVDYTGYVDMADGSEREISVTVMRDRRTGMYYLGNIERRIVVADCWQFFYNHGVVQLESSRDNLEWDQVGLKALYNYCRVYDYYQELGWTGGNGEGLPILILNNFCDENGAPVDNAAFVGNYLGWSIFLASRANDYSECLDVIAHEFTHCVTGTTTTYNAYVNDYGAINEAISDIQGQICELMMDPDPDDAWLMGENSGEAIRSMSEPLRYQQPEYTWDLYYQPNVAIPGDLNDEGGVHTNSSLLNRVGWSLCAEGGMSLAEARAFWFAVDCAMVPGTDYIQLRELLPWVLDKQGLTPYQNALAQAMETVRLGDTTLPETLAEDRAMVTLTLPENEVFADGNWMLQIYSVDVSGLFGKAIELLEKSESGETADFPQLLRMLLSEEAEIGEAAEDESLMEEAREWLRGQIRPYLYSGTGAAGQDGRTIRMVTKAGHSLPLLMHMTMDESTQSAQQVTFAVLFHQKWYDISSMMNQTDDGEEESFSFESVLEDETFQALVGDVLEVILNGEGLSALVYQIPGGQVAEMPDTGLERIQLSDGTLSVAEDAAEDAEPQRMSRPKVEE